MTKSTEFPIPGDDESQRDIPAWLSSSDDA